MNEQTVTSGKRLKDWLWGELFELFEVEASRLGVSVNLATHNSGSLSMWVANGGSAKTLQLTDPFDVELFRDLILQMAQEARDTKLQEYIDAGAILDLVKEHSKNILQ